MPPLANGNKRLRAYLKKKGIKHGTERTRKACYNAPAVWEYRRRLGEASGRPSELGVFHDDVDRLKSHQQNVEKSIDWSDVGVFGAHDGDDDASDDDDESHDHNHHGDRGEQVGVPTPPPQMTILRRRQAGGGDAPASTDHLRPTAAADASSTSTSTSSWGAMRGAWAAGVAAGVKGTMGTIGGIGGFLDAANRGTLFTQQATRGANESPDSWLTTDGDGLERVPTLLGRGSDDEAAEEAAEDVSRGWKSGGDGWSSGWSRVVESVIHTPVNAVAGAVSSGAGALKTTTVAFGNGAVVGPSAIQSVCTHC
jgi:hypothetical protein